MYNPCEERGFNMQVSVSPHSLVALDLFSFVYFSMELVIKVAALGLSGYNGSYLSNNWNKFDVFIYFGELLDYLLASQGIKIHVRHALRLMRLVGRVPSMQDMVMILLDTLPMLVNVLVLYMFVMFIFAIVGVQLWAGKLRNRCFLGVDIPENSSGWLNPYYVSKYDERSPFICSYDHSNGMRRCHDVPPYIRDEETCSLAVPNHSSAANKFLVPGAAANACVNWNSYYNICRAGDHNPNMGVTSFDNIGHALIVLFQMSSFIIMNVCAVVIATQFSESMTRQKKEQRANPAVQLCLQFLRWLWTIACSCISNGMRRCHDVPPYIRDEETCSLAVPNHSSAANKFLVPGAAANACVNWNSYYNICRAGDHNPNMGVTSFDNIGHALIVLFQVVTLEGWTDILFFVMDAHSFWSFIFFMLVTIKHTWEPLRRKLLRLINSKLFDRVIMLAVFFSILAMAIEHHGQPKQVAEMLRISNNIFTLVFVLELIVKLLVLKGAYFKDQNNIFDFAIVVISLWETFAKADGRLSVLRAFRMLRFVRLLHFLPYLKRQLLVLKATMKEAALLCQLLLFFTIIFSVIGMCLFGGKFAFETQSGSTIKDRMNFDSLLWSMVTVFQILTEEDWNLVLYNAVAATSQWTFFYFFAIILVGKHVLLNVLMGVVVQSFQAIHSSDSDDEDSISSTSSSQTSESESSLSENHETNGSSRPDEDCPLPPCGSGSPTVISSAPTDTNDHDTSLSWIRRVLRWCRQHEDWSFFLFSPQNRFRIFCQRVISHPIFDYVILLFILLSCVTLAIERPGINPTSRERQILKLSNYVFSAVFLVEMLFKIVALGLVYGKDSYCRSSWNDVDGLLVILSFVDIIVSLASRSKNNSLGFLKVLRLLRTLRPLRVIKRAPKLKLAVEALMASVKPIGNIVLICCAFFFFYGILGVQLFKGKFFHCLGEDITNITSKTDCLSADYRWVRKTYNFDNLPQALMALFVMYSKDGWVNIMYDGLDAVGVDRQPVRNSNKWMLLFFITFMIMSFLLLDMFIGVMVETFHQCQQEQKRRDQEEERGRARPEQCLCMFTDTEVEQAPYYTNYSPIRQFIHSVCVSNGLDLIMNLTIVLSVIFMALEHYGQSLYIENLIERSYYVLTVFLIIEVLLKLVAFGVWRFITNRWNLMDIIVVLVSIISIVLRMKMMKTVPINPSILRVTRALRLAQVLKLLKAKKIRVLMNTIIKTLSQVGNICLLFMFFFFIYAVLGVELFGSLECSDDHPCLGLHRYFNFKHFGLALLTLYQVCTGDNWSGILKDTLRECRPGNIRCLGYLSWVSPLFFTTFVVMVQFVLVNLVVAAIMQALEDSTMEEEEEKAMLQAERAPPSPEEGVGSEGHVDRSDTVPAPPSPAQSQIRTSSADRSS
ncbi:voltage-dependent T-type calcium channel subunit alpha-1H-like [Seriola lalandi dorsalis]|uniref:voltage-dependent T-type calcium channel subunit alpha-1H-like n=1 Tax=Seriola lalandi dorsalis TaxID=1841481 RepID=UPI000C6F7AB4|nr:voltage-dependent T-type calcium channel subunit alpha-1H-like [Seriola lalandi dorsalis]